MAAARKKAKEEKFTTTTAAKPAPKKSRTQPDKWDEETQTGRWHYLQRLGSGAYGETWKARDHKTGEIVCIKVQVSKTNEPKLMWQDTCAAFQMHEECAASRELLHNPHHPKYDAVKASLLVHYLEDHTKFKDFTYAQGAAWMNPGSACNMKECADALTDEDGGQYVVMEYLDYSTVRDLLKQEALPRTMVRQIAQKVAMVIDYLQSFDPPMIHRDIRVHNIMVKDVDLDLKDPDGDEGHRSPLSCVKVIDLGLMIRCRPFYDINPNPTLYLKCSNQQYWVPVEISKAWDAKTIGALNYCHPTHSFDVYSLGVLCVEMVSDPTNFFQKSSKTRVSVSDVVATQWESMGLKNRQILLNMVGTDPLLRPTPKEVYFELTRHCYTTPLGTMSGIYLRNMLVARFLLLVSQVCDLQLLRTSLTDELSDSDNKKALELYVDLTELTISLLVATTKDLERNYQSKIMFHLVQVCHPDTPWVSTARAEGNLHEIVRFLDFVLDSHNEELSDLRNHEERYGMLTRLFSRLEEKMIVPSTKKRKFSFIETLWMSNPPGPQNILAKWKKRGWFQDLYKYEVLDEEQAHIARVFLRPCKLPPTKKRAVVMKK